MHGQQNIKITYHNLGESSDNATWRTRGFSFLGKSLTFKHYATWLLSEEPIESELQEDSSTFLTSLVTKNHMMALLLPSPPLNLHKHSSLLI